MKQTIQRALRALGAAVLAVCMLTPVQAADTAALETALDQTARLQQLAEQYAADSQSQASPLMLTINYIRAQRYGDATWDMILGTPSEEFAQYAEQQDPALAQLQTLENVQIPATGQPVDFVHLVAGIGAACQRVPVVCTWGGDCIQLAGSIQGAGMDEEGCIQQLKPYFACEDENASLMPLSDWLADLDGVNIGTALADDDDLAEAIGRYYESITDRERARQFVLAQFGEADTGDRQTFRQQVKDKFFGDSGVQLLLLGQQQMTLDEERNIVVVDSMQAPLNAVCSLTADTLSDMLDDAAVTAESAAESPQTGQTGDSGAGQTDGGSASAAAPVLGQSALAQTMQTYSWLPWALGGVVVFCLLLLTVLARKSR